MIIAYVGFISLVAIMSVTIGLFHFWWIGQRATTSYVVITTITVGYTLLAICVALDAQICHDDARCGLASGFIITPGAMVVHLIGVPFQYQNLTFMGVAITLTALLAWLFMIIVGVCTSRVRACVAGIVYREGTLRWIKNAAIWVAQIIVASLAGAIGSSIIGFVLNILAPGLDMRNHPIDGESLMVVAFVGPLIGILMGLVGSLSGTWRRGLLSSLIIWGIFWDVLLLTTGTSPSPGGGSFGAVLRLIIICTIIVGSAGAISGWLREAWKTATSEQKAIPASHHHPRRPAHQRNI